MWETSTGRLLICETSAGRLFICETSTGTVTCIVRDICRNGYLYVRDIYRKVTYM